jgi:hypothetical protein
MNLTAKQSKITSKAQKKLGSTRVTLAVFGRGAFKMTPLAWIMVVVFVALLAVKALPGVLLLVIFNELVRAPRFLAVTSMGVTLMNRAPLGGNPNEAIATFSVDQVRLNPSKREVLCGDRPFKMKKKDFAAFETAFASIDRSPEKISILA